MNVCHLGEKEVPSPIFIIGAPRSGTSLLRNMLNRHPAIGLCDETYYFYYVYNRRRFFGDLSDMNARQRLVERYLATNRIKRLQLDLEALSHTLINEGDSYAAFFTALLRFYARYHGKERFGEKTPQHSLYTDTICKMFPNCKLIHIVRDPRDVVASTMRMPWAEKSITANARSWVSYTRSGSGIRNPANYLMVKYESLINNPSSTMKEICAFIGEDYESVMLVSKTEVDDKNPPNEWWFERAKGPLSQDRIERWRKELTPTQIALIEWIAGSSMRQYGYKLTNHEPGISKKILSILDEFSAVLKQKYFSLGRLWYYWIQPTKLAQEEAWIEGHSG